MKTNITPDMIKETIERIMMQVKDHAAKYGNIDALLQIGIQYEYAHTVAEKTALHFIIEHLRNNPDAAPYLPKLPQIK